MPILLPPASNPQAETELFEYFLPGHSNKIYMNGVWVEYLSQEFTLLLPAEQSSMNSGAILYRQPGLPLFIINSFCSYEYIYDFITTNTGKTLSSSVAAVLKSITSPGLSTENSIYLNTPPQNTTHTKERNEN